MTTKINSVENKISGILLINKPAGITSFDVIRKLRNTLRIKKIGHCGTLDPFASGLLIVCIGEATKVVEYFSVLDKKYVAVLHLGINTDTYDKDGKITGKKEVAVSCEDITEVLEKFSGKIKQIPPEYSAIKINGIRSYKLARAGVKAELPEREIEVFSSKIMNISLPFVTIEFHCSKGTYIRSLANDIGKSLDTGAHLHNLSRTQIGDFDILNAFDIDCCKEQLIERIIPIKEALYFIDSLTIKSEYKNEICFGRKLFNSYFIETANSNNTYKIFDENKTLLAIVECYGENIFKSKKVFVQ